ncbi:MAG: SUF system Fe-S cluster assembly regulator [Thermoanaerobaculia bacterium]|nr:SUF system Fe-S cluster assembly regulator [Thermoanaerobaculia bacterium]
MLRITKQTDYGIVLLSHMATDPDRLFTAPDLAEETRLPLPTVSKVLKLLSRDGLLDSQRGAKGGYSLSRRPEKIRVSDIIRCLEGPIAMTECIDDGPGVCDQEGSCPVEGNWQIINDAIRTALDRIDLSQMATPLPSRLVQLGDHRPGANERSDANTR